MNTYKLYWLDKKTEIVKGFSITDAFKKAGYSMGALNALDYYEDISQYRPDILTILPSMDSLASRSAMNATI